MIDEATINEAVELLRQAAPGSTIIVFGSCARGQITEDSDLDVLVIEPTLDSRHEEMVRLREVLRPLGIPADVLVVSKNTFEYWSDTPGTVFCEAAQEGCVFHATLA
jgi:predicted nucleotidyltransferase